MSLTEVCAQVYVINFIKFALVVVETALLLARTAWPAGPIVTAICVYICPRSMSVHLTAHAQNQILAIVTVK